MLRGIYTSASGMLADQRRLDVIANNLANVATDGFKRDTTISQTFQELYLQRVNDRVQPDAPAVAQPVGRMGLGTLVAHTATRLTSGSLQPTGNPLDVAISGDGFFAVQTPQGTRYTRQGSFRQDGEGLLVNGDGHPVLVGGRPVQSRTPLSIMGDGEVREGDRSLGQLTVATSLDLGAILKEGSGLWTRAAANETPTLITPAESTGRYRLHVGHLEASNVEAVTEMVEMLTVMRSHEANQRALQAQDESLQKVANEIGRIG